MKTKTLAFILIAALAACGNKNKQSSTGPSTKTDAKAGSMGGATNGGNTAPTPTTPPTTPATPNPCGAGM